MRLAQYSPDASARALAGAEDQARAACYAIRQRSTAAAAGEGEDRRLELGGLPEAPNHASQTGQAAAQQGQASRLRNRRRCGSSVEEACVGHD